MDILNQISKAIKEAKWLEISYQNKQDENTQYWIAIKDIDSKSRKLKVDMFNHTKSMNSIETEISFDRIKSAKVLNFCSYEDASKLAEKIESNLDAYQWLNYDHFNHNVLNYYEECNLLDADPMQKDYALIEGVDLLSLRKNKAYELVFEKWKLSFLLHEKTGEAISLNETSSGRRWYFSYYFMKSILEEGDMFIIDEPASMLHPSAQREVLLELEELAKKGVKVVYSTHSPYLIPQKWEGVNFVIMENGTKLLPFDLSSGLVDDIRSTSTMDIFWYQEVAEYYNKSKFKKHIARNIYSRLMEKYSVKEISVKLGITEQAVYKWQNDAKTIISLDNIFKIAFILKIDAFELIKETEL